MLDPITKYKKSDIFYQQCHSTFEIYTLYIKMGHQLRALNARLTGRSYLGRSTTSYDPTYMVRRAPPPATTFPRPQLGWRDIMAESTETCSSLSDEEAGRERSEEYRIPGLTWFTPRYQNSCNLDSFLSAFVRRVRQTHGKFLTKIVMVDRAGEALLQIGNHALNAKDELDSDRIKLIWLAAILRNSGELMELCNPPVNCAGNNTFSVFQHLFQHSGFEIVSKCQCGTFFHQDFVLEVPNVEQMILLGTPLLINGAQMPKCLTCNQFRILMELNPLENNWLLVFNYNGTPDKNNESPDFLEIPYVLTIGTLVFKIEYLCYSQEANHPTLRHEVSIQLIRRYWYLYDGGESPKFRKWYGQNYKARKALLRTVVYFRI